MKKLQRLRPQLVAVWGAFLMAALPAAQAASFDCAKAKSRTELLICRTDSLSALDEELNRRYKQLAAQTDASALKTDQLGWMRERDQCKDAACLADAYNARLKFLSTWNDADAEPANVAGVYGTRRPSFIHDPDTQKDEPVDLWDCLTLKRKSGSELEFKFTLFGSNAHTCEMEGVARKAKGSTYEYRETMELVSGQPECRLSISFHQGYVELLDEGERCRQQFCGMRASIGGTAFPRARANVKQCKD